MDDFPSVDRFNPTDLSGFVNKHTLTQTNKCTSKTNRSRVTQCLQCHYLRKKRNQQGNQMNNNTEYSKKTVDINDQCTQSQPIQEPVDSISTEWTMNCRRFQGVTTSLEEIGVWSQKQNHWNDVYKPFTLRQPDVLQPLISHQRIPILVPTSGHQQLKKKKRKAKHAA